ncbi:hypothetical protein M8C21_032958, partial [Ambrosia artemisiifolia]
EEVVVVVVRHPLPSPSTAASGCGYGAADVRRCLIRGFRWRCGFEDGGFEDGGVVVTGNHQWWRPLIQILGLRMVGYGADGGGVL